jgi:hypothetical protein
MKRDFKSAFQRNNHETASQQIFGFDLPCRAGDRGGD